MNFNQRILSLVFLWISFTYPAFARIENPRSLEQPQPDPLLPSLNRSLSPLERRVIQETIAQLNQEAEALLAENKPDQAFDHWFRVLNLQRALGRSQEIEGLTTIGQYAWERGRKVELEAITDRLIQLEIDLRTYPQNSLESERIDLVALGLAYQQVRALNEAQRFYQVQLDLAQKQGDLSAMNEILTQLIQVNWGALNYSLAADYTQQQLALLRSFPVTTENLQQERSLLNALAFLAKQTQNYETQILALEETIALTLDLGLREEIPDLLTPLARAYQDSGETDLAIQAYQKAYYFAQENQQFEIAQTILLSLGQLQEERGQLEAAIQTYELLRQVHRYSSNLLGLLDSYDRLGVLYLQTQQPTKAKEQFEQGLTLAKRLKYRESEFEGYLQQF